MKMHLLARVLGRRRTYRTVLQELSRYSNHELHDIGIDHADIHAIAHQMSEESSKRPTSLARTICLPREEHEVGDKSQDANGARVAQAHNPEATHG